MASRISAILLLWQVATLGFLLASVNGYGLKVGYYKDTCPNAEEIVFKVVASHFEEDRDVAAGLLRLSFHDCAVGGCEGSVLLKSTKKHKAERDAEPNLTLDGFEVLDAIKEALEKECPGIISCADIIQLAARDVVSLAATPIKRKKMMYKKLWDVECGRKDGVVSVASEAVKHLPGSFENFAQLKSDFYKLGLSVKDLVYLSGAHTIGEAHCDAFKARLYNNSNANGIDPTLDPSYAKKLRKLCKSGDEDEAEMDPTGSTTFDKNYYEQVLKHKGLFHSDAALLANKEASNYISTIAKSSNSKFYYGFGVSMVKLGRVGVITGNKGQIRKKCSMVNKY